jgi:hypothetical protein
MSVSKVLAVFLFGTSLWAQSFSASPLAKQPFTATPLMDLKTGTYLGFEGGLYENGSNKVPADHHKAGLDLMSQIKPINGKIVFLGIGMSNAGETFVPFIQLAQFNRRVNHRTLAMANGGGQGSIACYWSVALGSPTKFCPLDPPITNQYDRVQTQVLAPAHLTEDQVQVLWLYDCDEYPTISLPASHADAFRLEGYFGGIARAARIRYPNLKLMFLTSREYAGYAKTNLNPEPYAYEAGFSAKWVIQAQVHQIRTGYIDPIAGDLDYSKGVSPWIVWSSYTWANGTNPRSDGLVWCNGQLGSPCFGHVDVGSDGTHPSLEGRQDLASLLMKYFLNSPYATKWFLAKHGR